MIDPIALKLLFNPAIACNPEHLGANIYMSMSNFIAEKMLKSISDCSPINASYAIL